MADISNELDQFDDIFDGDDELVDFSSDEGDDEEIDFGLDDNDSDFEIGDDDFELDDTDLGDDDIEFDDDNSDDSDFGLDDESGDNDFELDDESDDDNFGFNDSNTERNSDTSLNNDDLSDIEDDILGDDTDSVLIDNSFNDIDFGDDEEDMSFDDDTTENDDIDMSQYIDSDENEGGDTENNSNSTTSILDDDDSDFDNFKFDELSPDGIDGLAEDLDGPIISSPTSLEAESADYDGSIVSNADLYDEDEPDSLQNEMDFISDSGSIVVQDKNDTNENGFQIVYLNIDNIAITPRIRKMQSVEGLVQSIQSTGLLRPLIVAPLATEGMYVLIDGYRRLQACARAGKVKVPCVVNTKVSTPEIRILESLYNHSQRYDIKEQIEYIDYLEKEKGIMNPSMIEYLLQMNSGDYTKLKDILNDNDDDIVTKLYDGVYDIATAFKKLEQRRKKESATEKVEKQTAKVYDDEEESGVDQIAGAGEEADGSALTEEQIASLTINAENLDDEVEESSLGEMIEEDKNIEGFQPHKQKVGEREYIDPIIKKSVMTRDKSTCQCCKRGGEQYVDILDYHHLLPIFLGGTDSIENGIMLCVSCHRLVHLYSTGDLHIDRALLENDYDSLSEEQKSRFDNEQIFEDEKMRFKRIIKLGGVIRRGIAAKGLNKEQYKKEHSNNGIGRRKPGVNAEQEAL